MFIIDITYQVPLEQIDRHMKEHMIFLNKHYDAGHFLLSGRKLPRTGGIIISKASSKQELEGWLAEDPFFNHQLATFTITEFNPSQFQAELSSFINS